MAVDIPFRREIAFEYGRLEPIAPGIRRIVARNPGPFTFKGTGTYVVGEGEVAVIDPGPEMEEHIAAVLASLAEEQVTHILVTHTHRDHSPAAKALKEATGAPTYGFGPHAGGKRGEAGVEEGGDWDFTPDVVHVRAFIAHRREREAGVIDCLKAGIETVDRMVERLYVGLNPSLRRAAGRSVLAHLIDLTGRDIVTADGPATVEAHFRLRHKPR